MTALSPQEFFFQRIAVGRDRSIVECLKLRFFGSADHKA
jgi:hypothetical protein